MQRFVKLLIDRIEENNKIVRPIEEINVLDIESVFLDHNTGKQYTNVIIQSQIINSVEKIQNLVASDNIRESRIDKAHELCAEALAMISQKSLENAEQKTKNISKPNATIEKYVVSNHNTVQQNCKETLSSNHHGIVLKNPPPVPPKPKNLINKNLLLQEKYTDGSEDYNSPQSKDNDPWNEIDNILENCMQYLNHENINLVGDDGFAQ